MNKAFNYTARCRDCKEEYSLTNIELRAYRERGWPIPERCRVCRHKQQPEKNSENLGPSIVGRVING